MERKQDQHLDWDLDEVLTELKFGRYQLINIFLIGLLVVFTNISPLSFTLTAGDLNYRCRVPECENESRSTYMTGWLRDAIPFHDDTPYKCKRYKPLTNLSHSANDSICLSKFDSKIIEDCNDWIFATEEKTLVNSFHIMCENRIFELTLIGTINNIGQFVGIPVFGMVSDRLGRKFVAVVCMVTSCIFGIMRGFSTSYLMFVIFEFLDAFFCSPVYGTIYTLGIELVNPEKRALACTLVGAFYPLGAIFMGLLAWYFQDWRKLLVACYTPGLFFILHYWLLPESVRWLLTKGRESDAIDILKTISKRNGKALPNTVLQQQQKKTNRKLVFEEKEISFWKPLAVAFNSKYIMLRLLNCSFAWFTTTLVYYGLSIHSVNLVGNKYLNFILTNGVELPAFIFSGITIKKIKRRVSQSTVFFLAGLACIICEFVPAEMFLLHLIVYLTSKFLISLSFHILYIYSAEMFPTELRLSLCGFASMLGRTGSMIAPQTMLLEEVAGKHAPLLLFGAMAMVAGGLATLFPETLNKKLPNTLTEAKMINE